MNNGLSLDALKSHLFEAIEGVKNLSDPDASESEKTSIEQAKAIRSLAGGIIDIYKVQIGAMNKLYDMQGETDANRIGGDIGIIDKGAQKQIG